jgi:succinyl-CoA synthetase beta subunit
MHTLDLMLQCLKSTSFKTSDNKIMAVDAKVNIDDNALHRQKAYADMRDFVRKSIEVEAKEVGLNYVILTVLLDVWLTELD